VTSSWRDGLFFGIHYDLHATAEDTALGSELTAEHLRAELDRTRPDWVQCDAKGILGYTSYATKVGSPSPGIVQDALRIHREVTAERGMPLVVHYCGLWDARAIELHPDWAAVAADGTPSADHICARSPYRDELMIPQLLELITDYDIDGAWVDAENWGANPCWCPRCLEAFDGPAPRSPGEPGWQEWLAGHREAFTAHLAAYTEAVHEAKPGFAVASNWAGALIQPGELGAAVDWLSGDVAPSVSPILNARAFDRRGMPFELMTWAFITPYPGHPVMDLKTLDHLSQEVAIGMACGGGAAVYDLPERTGHLVSWRQQRLADLVTWCRERQEVVLGTRSVPQVAVLQSERHHYLHNSGLFGTSESMTTVRGAVLSLLDADFHVDLITEADLAERASRYRLVVVPEQEDLSREAVAELDRYALDGGALLLTGARLAGAMGELAGVRAAGALSGEHVLLATGDESIHMTGPWQPVDALESSPVAFLLASREPSASTTDVAITERAHGRGRVVAAHGPLFAHHATYNVPGVRELIAQLCRRAQPSFDVEVEAPLQVHHTVRENDGSTIVHLLNMTGSHPLAPVTTHVEAIPEVGPITVRLRTDVPPAGVHLVPSGSELSWSTDGGWTTVLIPRLAIHTAVVLDGAHVAAATSLT